METTEKENVSAKEAQIAATSEEAKVKKNEDNKKEGVNCFGKKCSLSKNVTTIGAVVLFLALIGGSYVFAMKKKAQKEIADTKNKVEKFIKENLVQPGTEIAVKDIAKEGALYKLTITIGSGKQMQETPVYVTSDGKLFPAAPIDINKNPNEQAKDDAQGVPEKTEAEQKADVPIVDLFVMSYCPYGLQMERGILPAVEALGNKIKFNLKFVDYTLHGQKEVDENVRQYCIEKTQPTKLNNYLKCFWKDSKGAADACMKSTGINAAQVASCAAETVKQFNPTEKALGLNKEETEKFEVQGSPTLVVNGTTISANRDSASVLKAICSGFSKTPKECETKLSTTAAGAGFDDQIAAAGAANGGNASAASCEN